MPIDTLRQHLAQLNEEIARADAGDPAALEHVRQLARDLERELEEERTLADPAAAVTEVQRAVSGFEASHPTLTAVLNNILITLGNMGV